MDRLEIMAPAGSFECLRAAIQGGADSVYFGVGRLNMRSRSAANFDPQELQEVVRICHEAGVKAYLTLNIILYDNDLQPMREAMDAAVAAGVDAVIASDIAVLDYARSKGMEVHASTQLNISNVEALRFWSRWVDVAVLARELSMDQVREISRAVESEGICGPSGKPVRIEMFAHGALCMAVSGKCYMSLHAYGASANRGACMQVCRRGYGVTDLETGYELNVDNEYIMSPKDLCTIGFMDLMADCGVKVFKIEGRARSAEYVLRCTQCYRKAADAVQAGGIRAEVHAVLPQGGRCRAGGNVHPRTCGRTEGAVGRGIQPRLLGRLLSGCQAGRVELGLWLPGHQAQGLPGQGHQLVRPYRRGGNPCRSRTSPHRGRDYDNRPNKRGYHLYGG